MLRVQLWLTLSVIVAFANPHARADWTRFRGPNGSGVAAGQQATPVTWGEKQNLKWKVELPGQGISSPIVVGDRVFVTSYSGYGLDADDPGRMEDLQRHLVCIDRHSGQLRWSQSVSAVQPEDPYGGFIREHGYASNTPVSDGERVYAFFGKSGVVAFDLEGNQLWQQSVGTESGPQRWGSGASPILYKNLVIVNASEENEALYGLNKETGEQVWKAQATGLGNCWGTPILVEVDGRTELVLGVPYEIWGLNPDNGKLLWFAESFDSNQMCGSLVTANGIVYAVEGRQGGAVAVRAGGKGDVTKTHVLWNADHSARIATPILYDQHLYWVSRSVAHCIDAATGERVFQGRLTGGAPAAAPGGSPRGGGGGRRGFGGFGGGGGQDYASCVVADGKIYATMRNGDVFVLAAQPKFEQLARNRFADDSSDFNATPAVSDGQLFIRSQKVLYCVATEAD